MPWFRESEIRHGRTAMLAVVGFIATDFVRIPGEMYSFEAIPKTIDAHDALLKTGPMYQLLLFIGLFDIVITGPAAVAASKGEREPGGKLPVSNCVSLVFFCLRELISFFASFKRLRMDRYGTQG
jgi:Chlorophyll A-B binding protein